jgi:hypothetical protein
MPKRHLLAASGPSSSRRHLATALTQTAFGVCPLEALGKDISYVGQIQQKERHADDSVDDSYHLADL